MPSVTQQLLELGQSVWLDYLSRELLDSGRLVQMVRAGDITGLTSNPTIFEKAIATTSAYEGDLQALRRSGETDAYEAFLSLASSDIRRACDVLQPVYEQTQGQDGFVSLEVRPGTEFDTGEVVAEATRLHALVGRANLMIKVPGTAQGVEALELLVAQGVSVNQTLLFDVAVYESSARAYIRALQKRKAAGEALSSVAGVASFFVSRVDTAIDSTLADDSPLRGRAAVANARYAYKRFLEIFSGAEWDELAAAGGRVQRPLWASTGTKNPAYSDVLYVSTLIAPDTVNTLPEATLTAAMDHLEVRPTLVDAIPEAERTLAALRAEGVDLKATTDQLLVEGLASFERDFLKLLARLSALLTAAPASPGS